MKQFPPEVITLLESGKLRYCHLLEIRLQEAIRLTDLGHDIDFNGETYRSSGQLISLDNATSTTQIRINEISIGITAADSTFPALILGFDNINREVNITRLYLDENNRALHADVFWSGNVTGDSMTDSKDNPIVTLNAASVWADFERVNSWRTEPNSHARRTSDDEIFKYAAKTKERIIWGGSL